MAGAFGPSGRTRALPRCALAFLALILVSACGPLVERIKTEPLAKPAEPIASLGIVVVDEPLTRPKLLIDLVPKSATDQIETRRAQILRVAPPTLENALRFYGIDGRAIVASYPLRHDEVSSLAAYDYILILTPAKAQAQRSYGTVDDIWFYFTASLIERSRGTELWRASNIIHLGYVGRDLNDRGQSILLVTTFRDVLTRMARDGYLAVAPEALKSWPKLLPRDAFMDGNSGTAANADGAGAAIDKTPQPFEAPAPTSLAALPTSPRAQAVEFVAPRLGMRVYPDTGGFFEITSVEGATVKTVNAASNEATWVGLFLVPGSPDSKTFDRREAESIWPLEVGKSVSFKMSGIGAQSGANRTWQETITVLRREEITTEAGRFQTVVVEARERSLTGHFQSVTTYWYAPDVGFVVKYQHEITDGKGKPRAWTVARIVTPGS